MNHTRFIGLEREWLEVKDEDGTDYLAPELHDAIEGALSASDFAETVEIDIPDGEVEYLKEIVADLKLHSIGPKDAS